MDIIPYISFLTGVLSIISPCILPVLPIILGFTIKEKKFSEILSFTVGFFLIFLILIFVTTFFSVAFHRYDFYFKALAAIIIFIIGLMFILDKSFSIIINRFNTTSSFILGFLTSIAWAPCYGPYLISLVGLLLTSGDGGNIAFNIILYSLGFGFALFIIAILLSKINLERFVKRSSDLRKIVGVLFIIGALYMFLTLFGVII